MTAITDTLQHHGAAISRATWNGRADAAELAADVKKIPDLHGGSNQVCTWRIAYRIEGIRDWLFAQHATL